MKNVMMVAALVSIGSIVPVHGGVMETVAEKAEKGYEKGYEKGKEEEAKKFFNWYSMDDDEKTADKDTSEKA